MPRKNENVHCSYSEEVTVELKCKGTARTPERNRKRSHQAGCPYALPHFHMCMKTYKSLALSWKPCIYTHIPESQEIICKNNIALV